jgi:pyocin large subunit-like protein
LQGAAVVLHAQASGHGAGSPPWRFVSMQTPCFVNRGFHQSAYTVDSKSAVVDFVENGKNGTRTKRKRGIRFRD